MGPRRRDDETRGFHEDEEGVRRKPSRKGRRTKKESSGSAWVVALVAGVLLAGVVAGGLWWRARRVAPATPAPPTDTLTQPGTGTPASPSDLEAAIAEADRLDPGWRWDQIWAKRAVVPDPENSARIVIEAGRLLPRGAPDVPGFVDRAGETRLNGQQRAELNAWLKPRADAMDIALTLADRPRGRFDIQVAPDFISTLLPDIQTTRQIVNLLRAEAVRRAETGNAGQLEEFRAMLNAARSIGDEPMVISQIIRVINSNLAIQSLEQTLARTAPNEEALTAAQNLLNEEAGYNARLVAWRGERAIQFGFLDAVDTGRVSLEQVGNTLRGLNKTWPADSSPGSPGLRAARAWSLRHMTGLVEIAKKPTSDQAAALAALRQNEKQAPAAATLFIDIDSTNPDWNSQKLFQRREALLRSALVAVAAERYRLKNDRWPLEPKDLAAFLVGPAPTDPYDGSTLRFRRLDDGLVVYSIGPNGRDDSGDLGDRKDNAPDIGFRLWDADKRR